MPEGAAAERARESFLAKWRKLSISVAATLEQPREELLACVTRHAEAITTVDRLRPEVSPAARLLLTHGTAAIEKNIEILVGRRFKRWGMRWTRRAAHHLLKLRLWIARCRRTWTRVLNCRPHELTKR